MILGLSDKSEKVALSADIRRSDAVAPAGRHKYLLLLKMITIMSQSSHHGHVLLVNVMPRLYLVLLQKPFVTLSRTAIQLLGLPFPPK